MEETTLLRSPVSGSPSDQKPNEYAGSERRPPRSPSENHGLHLTPTQQAVASELLEFGRGESEHSIATLMGYAGVGKTTVVAHVVHALAASGVRIVVLAPTHKALSVLAEKIDDASVDTMTLQSALALKVSERPDGTQTVVDKGEEGSLRDYDLAVIDEASMVSDAMFATALIKRRRCRLLFVGDPAQLPPVDKAGPEAPKDADGLSPAFGPMVPKRWTMTEVVRQAQGNPIIRVATAARACIEAGQEFGLHTISEHLQEGDDDFMAMQPGSVLDAARLVADAISYGQDTRALAWDNNSVQAINAHVHAMVHPGKGDYPDGTLLMAQDGFTGISADGRTAKVPVRNSALLTVRGCRAGSHPAESGRDAYELELEDESGARLRCWFARDQRQWQADISEHFADYRRIKLREQLAHGPERDALNKQARASSDAGWALRTRFAPLRYAYAMTVHKSQGSTFDAVVLAWDSFQRCRDFQLRNRLAYVALTRTRKFAVVCA